MFTHIKPPAGTQINPLHPLSQGLVGCWLFNEGAGSLVNDISGHGNHGRLTNMAPNVQGSGWGGGGLNFDGDNDYVVVPRNNLQGMSEFTISVWIKRNSFTSFGGIIGELYNADNTKRHFFISEYNSDGNITMYIYGGGGFKNIYTTTSDVLENEVWVNIVGVFKGGEYLKLYKNGIEIQSGSTTITSIHTDTELDLFIGRYSGNELNSSIDTVRIYNRALSADVLKQLYEDPFCNMMKRPINRYYVAVAGGLSMAVAMHHYNQMKEN